MQGKAVVVGVGESAYYKRGGATETEFQLACIAIRNAVADAGLTLSDVDGFTSYMDRNEPVRLSAALGTGPLRFTGADVRRRRQRRRPRRSRWPTWPSPPATPSAWSCSGRSPRASSAATGRPASPAPPGAGRRSPAPYGMLSAGPDLRHADHAVHARPRRHPGSAGRGGARLLRPRPAQPAGDPLRLAARPARSTTPPAG